MFGWRKRKGASGAHSGPESGELLLRCSFCNKTGNDVRKLIAGPTVYICDECVEVCVDIIADDVRLQGPPQDSAESQPPRAIVGALVQHAVTCSLCGMVAPVKEVLPIEDRGFLCGGCADAVADAIARGKPV
jgi:hypothetical protein